jgi:hypothetical protein
MRITILYIKIDDRRHIILVSLTNCCNLSLIELSINELYNEKGSVDNGLF